MENVITPENNYNQAGWLLLLVLENKHVLLCVPLSFDVSITDQNLLQNRHNLNAIADCLEDNPGGINTSTSVGMNSIAHEHKGLITR